MRYERRSGSAASRHPITGLRGQVKMLGTTFIDPDDIRAGRNGCIHGSPVAAGAKRVQHVLQRLQKVGAGLLAQRLRPDRHLEPKVARPLDAEPIAEGLVQFPLDPVHPFGTVPVAPAGEMSPPVLRAGPYPLDVGIGKSLHCVAQGPQDAGLQLRHCPRLDRRPLDAMVELPQVVQDLRRPALEQRRIAPNQDAQSIRRGIQRIVVRQAGNHQISPLHGQLLRRHANAQILARIGHDLPGLLNRRVVGGQSLQRGQHHIELCNALADLQRQGLIAERQLCRAGQRCTRCGLFDGRVLAQAPAPARQPLRAKQQCPGLGRRSGLFAG